MNRAGPYVVISVEALGSITSSDTVSATFDSNPQQSIRYNVDFSQSGGQLQETAPNSSLGSSGVSGASGSSGISGASGPSGPTGEAGPMIPFKTSVTGHVLTGFVPANDLSQLPSDFYWNVMLSADLGTSNATSDYCKGPFQQFMRSNVPLG